MTSAPATWLPRPTPLRRFVITGFGQPTSRRTEVQGWVADHEVALRYDAVKGSLLIAEGDVVRPPRFDELRDLKRVFDAWVARAATVPDIIARVRVGITELLLGPAKLEQFHLTRAERAGGFTLLFGTVGQRGSAVVTLEHATGAVGLRYEAIAGAPSRVRALQVSELAGLLAALDRQPAPGVEALREAVRLEFEVVSGERPDPTLEIGVGAPV